MNFFKLSKTFIGGIRLPENKETTQSLPVVNLPLPGKVIIPVIQHVGRPAVPVVTKGEHVKTGQLIAKSNSFISSNIHSSISGIVKEIREHLHPVTEIQKSLALSIESDNEDSLFNRARPLSQDEVGELNPSEILEKIEEAGIVGLGGAGFPAHVKLTPINNRKNETYVVNGTECEPFITCDYRLMTEKSYQIILGLKTAMKAAGVQKAFVGIKKSKRQLIELFKKALEKENNISVVGLDTAYPQGAEKQLIKTVLNKEVPSGKLPLDIGVIVSNIATIFSIYEAVYESKALYERIITVTGSGILRPANLKVRIGTPLKKIVEFCGLKTAGKVKIIVGGPMTGYAQSSLETPVVKGSSCVLVFIDREIKDFKDNPCLKCARCVDICPTKLIPAKIAQLVKHQRISELDKFNIDDCINCGCCAYVCPASISLLELIKLGKIKKRILNEAR